MVLEITLLAVRLPSNTGSADPRSFFVYADAVLVDGGYFLKRYRAVCRMAGTAIHGRLRKTCSRGRFYTLKTKTVVGVIFTGSSIMTALHSSRRYITR